MYSLTCSDTYQYPDSDDTPYVLDIFPIGSGLAATSSDSLLSLFDPLRLASGPVMRTSTRHGTLTAARPYDGTESVVATAGEDGHVALWDLRQAATAPALELQGVRMRQNPDVLDLD
jgi:WD40 repeat protein